jgi:hypothetical protein
MKKNFKHYRIGSRISKWILVFALAMTSFAGCQKSYLTPDPLNLYEPNATFTSKAGLDAAMAICDRHIRSYWTYFNYQDLSLPISTEYMFSDVAVAAKTDDGNIFSDIATRLAPTDMPERLPFFWDETYNGIKYANTVLAYADKLTDASEAVKNEFKGRALFHRSFRYLALVFEFKDVPLVT